MRQRIFFIIVMLTLIFQQSCTDNCPLNKVILTNFWNDTNETIGIDPLGGYIFIYWIDSNGNACHGEPGISGQPGPLVIKAFSQQAFNAAQSNQIISEEQMKQIQEFLYENVNYHISGYHFVQFDNVIWRNKADGKVFMDKGSHYFSKPVIANMENTVCLSPVYAARYKECSNHSGLLLPNPFTGNQQHPSIGLTKSQPITSSLSENDLMKYCVLNLPYGLDISE